MAPIRDNMGLKTIVCSFLQLRVEWGLKGLKLKLNIVEVLPQGKHKRQKSSDHAASAQVHIIIYLRVRSKDLIELFAAARQNEPCQVMEVSSILCPLAI